MKSKITKSKDYRKQTTSTKKYNSNYAENNKNPTLEKFCFLIIVIFIFIGIFLSVKESNAKLTSTNFKSNKENFEQAAKTAKSYWRFAELYRDDIIEQLISEGFTYNQAVYGLEENDGLILPLVTLHIDMVPSTTSVTFNLPTDL